MSDRHELSISTMKMVFVLLAPASLIGVLIYYATYWGAGVGHDSMFYLDAARSIIHGEGFSWIGSGGELKPLTHYPPAYSMLLSIPLLLGAGPQLSTRAIAIVVSLANSIFIAFVLLRYTRIAWFAFLGTITVVMSPVFFRLHTQTMSEPLFYFFILLSFYCLVAYLTSDQRKYLYATAFSVALAALTRYVGLAVLLSCVVVLILLKRGTLKNKVIDAAQLGFLGFLPLAFWMIRNWLLTGTATNRTFGVHLANVDTLRAFLDVVFNWFTSKYLSHWLQGSALILFYVGLLLYSWWRLKKAGGYYSKSLVFALLLGIFPIIYSLQLLTSLSFFDASTRIDDRILSPVFLTLMLAILMLPSIVNTSRVRVSLMAGMLVILAVGYVPRAFGESMRYARTMHEEGWGFSSKDWNESELIRWIRMREWNARIITDQALAVRFLTERETIQVPEKWDPVKDQERENYQSELREVLELAYEPNNYVVLFRPKDISAPRDRTWVEEMVLIFETQEGEVYVFPDDRLD